MSAIAWLQMRKAWQLKYACFLAGLPTTGTKAELASGLSRALSVEHTRPGKARIVSVDMGIRNLGTCVIDSIDSPAATTTARRPSNKALEVVAWQKTDVLSRISPDAMDGKVEPDESETSSAPASKRKISAADFSPSSLATVACGLTRGWLDAHRPDHILIERQRFRSGGASAVQEWTLRVNMLESMLWASLRTMEHHGGGSAAAAPPSPPPFPSLEEVLPARVAAFWCCSPSASARQVPPGLLSEGSDSADCEALWEQVEKKKVEKKDKIAVVRAWLTAPSDAAAASEVPLDFTPEAKAVADAFLVDTRRGPRRKDEQQLPASSALVGFGKLDDLADCLLQAVAWVKWTRNREAMRRLVDEGLRAPSG